MKDEINSDIASFVSDEEYSDYSDTESQSWTEGEFSGEEEEEEGEYEEEDDYTEYETEDDDYVDVKNDSEAKQIVSGESSSSESEFYENEDENAEVVRQFTPAVRSSQSIDSEQFVEAQEHLEFQNIADEGNLFEALLPPPAFSDEIVADEQINGFDQPESFNQQQTTSDEANLDADELQQNFVEIQYDEETDASEESQDDSEASDSKSFVANVEFETVKRNSIDLQENAVFIQQQLNKTTTVVVERSSTEFRDEVSPAVEIPIAESTRISEDRIISALSPGEEAIGNDSTLR